MVYIIPEDRVSGRILWEHINEHLLGGKAQIISKIHGSQEDVGGVSTISIRYYEAIDSGVIKPRDSVVIAIDDTRSMKVAEIKQEIEEVSKRNNITVKFTTYNSMEEIFLSFEFFVEWVGTIKNDKSIKFLEHIRCCILNNCSFSDIWNGWEDIIEYILKDNVQIREHNREQFMSALLKKVTEKNKGFYVSKSNIGVCWIEDCCEYNINVLKNPKITRFVKRCGLAQSLSAQEKLRILIENSIIEVLTPHFIDELQALI